MFNNSPQLLNIFLVASTCTAVFVWLALQMQKRRNARLELHADARAQSLQHEEARLRAILATALDGFIATDRKGVITEFNTAAEHMFGYSRNEAIGHMLSALIVLPHERVLVDDLTLQYDQPPAQRFFGKRREAQLLRHDGSQFPAEFAVSSVELGDEVFFHVFVRDITARNNTQAALQAAKDAAEAASDAKTTFLATMSHEIRTPMNALLGLQELLSYSRLDDEQRESVRLMRQSSRSLLRLIDDILDFSRIEAGKLEINKDATVLQDVVDSVCATFMPIANEKGLHLSSQFADSVPKTVLTDPLRLRQILNNLISNAIKFTDSGVVSLWVSPAHVGGQSNLLRFEVEDSGIGMSEEALSRCGEPFQQADARMARKYGGSGLGLAICRRLCNLMQGEMQISSTLGCGTRISVTLPLEVVAEQRETFRPDITQGLIISMPSRAPSVETAAACDQLILVVDDHPTNRTLLVQQLEWLGYACEPYADGKSALMRYRERLAMRQPFAMTITDCQMPEMDGYELAKAIRASEIGNSHKTVLIAFTANTLRGVQELCHSCGFNDLMTKPVNLATLKAKLDRWMPLAQAPALLVGSEKKPPTFTSPLHDPEMQSEFRSAHEEDLALLNEAVQANDFALVMRAAHRIAGAARMLGAKQLDEAAGSVHRAARAEDWLQVRESVATLLAETDHLFEQFSPSTPPLRLSA